MTLGDNLLLYTEHLKLFSTTGIGIQTAKSSHVSYTIALSVYQTKERENIPAQKILHKNFDTP